MDEYSSLQAHKNDLPPLLERRKKPRVGCSYPAALQSNDAAGHPVEERAILANMSVSGLYLRTHRYFPLGKTISVTVRLSTAELVDPKSPHMVAFGRVVRVHPQPDGAYGIALQLDHYQLL